MISLITNRYRLYFTSFLILLTLSCLANSRYSVFNVSGNIMVMTTNEWKKAEKLDVLSASTKISIPQGGRIGIKDNQSLEIYYSQREGEMTVVRLIMDAKKNAKAKTSAIKNALNGTNTKNSRPVLGGVMRKIYIPPHADNNYTSPSGLGTAIKKIAKGNQKLLQLSNMPFALQLITNPDQTASFIIESNLPETNEPDNQYALNILRIKENTKPTFIIPMGDGNTLFTINKPGKITIDWIPTLYDPEATYYLLATKASISHDKIEKFILQNFMSQDSISRPSYILFSDWNSPTSIIPARK